RLEELLTVIREAGLPVTCQVAGQPAPLPPGIDLTAFRIIQEALTNALRHAPGSCATVRLGYAPGELTVEVTNTAPRPACPAAPAGAAPAAPAQVAGLAGAAALGPGYGLAGIAERVASCGGFLALGPAAGEGRGFTVTTRLPLR